MLYGAKRVFKNGRKSKRYIAIFEAGHADEVWEAFGILGLWSGYPESSDFVLDILDEIPKTGGYTKDFKPYNAKKIVSTYGENEMKELTQRIVDYYG